MRTLSIIRTAFRAHVEEQDDTSIWFNHSCIKAGTKIDIMLRGEAINYGCVGQEIPKLKLGYNHLEKPVNILRELESLKDSGAQLFYVKEEAEAQRINPKNIITAVDPIPLSAVPNIFSKYQQIFSW